MQQCPICGKPYLKAVPTEFGGMEYIHQTTDTFQSSCLQSSAAYKEQVLTEALEEIRDTAKSWEGRAEAPYWNLGDIAAAALKRAGLVPDNDSVDASADWLSPAILPHGSSIAIAMLNYGSTHGESWLFSPDLRPDLTLAVGQVVLAVLPALKDAGPKGVIIGKIEELVSVEGEAESVDVRLAPLACRGPVAEQTGQPLGQPVIVNDFEIYRVLDAANWPGAKGEAENA